MSPAIAAVWDESCDELARRITMLDAAAVAVAAGELDETLRERARGEAHRLAGSLGMFGLRRGSEVVREVEHALALPGGPARAEAPHLQELLRGLREEVALPDAGAAPAGRPDGHRPALAPEPVPAAGIALLLVGSDTAVTDRLATEAIGRRFRPRWAATSADARRLAAVESPDAVVLDVSFGGGAPTEDLGLIEDLANRTPPVPVVVLSGSDALVDRVEIARRGGRGFMARTRPARQVLDIVHESITQRDRSHTKVLAVDDDPTVSAVVCALLTPRGLAVSTINDPLCFWDALEEVRPDLLMLDFDMPGLNGIDLCRAVRADSRFGQLPVLFLTGHTDPISVQRMFEAGADDYVGKPVVAPELITRILNRLERVTLLRRFAERDSLTGVADRRASTAGLDDLIAMSDRFGQPLSLAVLDVDSFKALNDRLGHAAGDRALQSLAALLVEAFRGEDIIGRWGGDEFVVGMYGMARDDGVQRLGEVLEIFRRQEISGRAGACAQMSFTAGVAEYPVDAHDLHELYKAADQALYAAKRAGRDRVLPAG